jgi:hypothetical protein
MSTNRLNINKLAGKPEWSEVVKLYFGLFDSQGENEDFIIDLSQGDTSLVADCELSSLHINSNITENLKRISALKYLNGKKKPDLFAEAIVILKLGDENYFLDLIENNYAKVNIREHLHNGLSHLSQESIFSLITKLIKNSLNIYSKWIMSYLLAFDKYSVSADQAEEAIETLTFIKNG